MFVVPCRVEDSMACQQFSRGVFGRQHIICTGIPEIPVKRELVYNRYDLAIYLFPDTKNDARSLPFIHADNNIPCTRYMCCRPCSGIIVISPDDVSTFAVIGCNFEGFCFVLFNDNNIVVRDGKAVNNGTGDLVVSHHHGMSREAVRGPPGWCRCKKSSEERGKEQRNNNEDHDHTGQHDLNGKQPGNFTGERQ